MTCDHPPPKVLPYTCRRCRKRFCGLCTGAADDYPDLCDDCWAVMSRQMTKRKDKLESDRERSGVTT